MYGSENRVNVSFVQGSSDNSYSASSLSGYVTKSKARITEISQQDRFRSSRLAQQLQKTEKINSDGRFNESSKVKKKKSSHSLKPRRNSSGLLGSPKKSQRSLQEKKLRISPLSNLA